MDTLQSLKSEILKPFQTVTILMGFKDMKMHHIQSHNIQSPRQDDISNIRHGEFVNYYYDTDKIFIYDIFYKISKRQYKIYQPWNYVKHRANDMGCKCIHEIMSDTLINLYLSSNILNKYSVDGYYENLIDVVKYHHTMFDKPIILRIDNYNGNKFFMYNGETL